MPRKTEAAIPREGVVMPVEAFEQLHAFQQQLHGIVRTLQPEVLLAIGYRNSMDEQVLRDIFTALATSLAPVVAACVWTPDGDDHGGLAGTPRLH
ncbi:hypothetical protein [Lysobacter capsici]|uniref:hypothetical protein n=1 Tax=Lysobacter capsici TaxID=435897 RepID=UPI001C002A60|nr:hypothetical protein [Lysobacter capsici]QWF18838.1 hypothetical protein KME82_08920 [Lysobacter capsici]